MAIVLVGEDLGLGWDPGWTKERKEKIASVYRETRREFALAAPIIPLEASEPSS